MRSASFVGAAVVAAVASSASAALNILVYDENSNNHYAATAANQKFPGRVTIAGAANFNTLLTGGTAWDLVVMDYPSTHPVGGTTALVNYVNGGGRAILSTWAGVYTPALFSAFGATSGSSISTAGQTLSASGTPASLAVFAGVPGMPHSSWFDSWASDGAQFNTAGGTVSLALLTGAANPVMILGNSGRTIASLVLDEWQGPGAVELWRNMMNQVIPAPGAVALLGFAGLVGVRRRRTQVARIRS